MKLCECGCGEEARKGNRFINGHYVRVNPPMKNPETVKKAAESKRGFKHTEETKRKLKEILTGRKHTEETKRKIREKRAGKKPSEESNRKRSESLKGREKTEEHRRNLSKSHMGHIPWNKGKTGIYSEESLKKMSEGHKGQVSWCKGKKNIFSEETLKRVSAIMKKKSPSKRLEVRLKLIEAGKRRKHTEEERKKISIGRTGKKHTKEAKEKMSRHHKGKPAWNKGKKNIFSKETLERWSKIRSEKFKDPKFLENFFKSMNQKPNKIETLLEEIVNPLGYEYVGNYKFWIDRKNPDFINEQKKKIIELFGVYWHSEEIIGIPKEQHEYERIEHFKRYDYNTLIIWESELKDIERVIEKIVEFTNRKE